jgi:hypothetical protein
MPKRSSSPRSLDTNELAAHVVRQTTGTPPPKKRHRKNPAAVALGRRGGLKGGKARAAKLSPEERKAIARRAAEARWKQEERA